MKAYVLHGINDLRYEDLDVPDCKEQWAIVKVKAAGICSSDIARIFTKGTYHFPTIPGHEFSGVVQSVGSETNKNLIGQNVGVFPLIPCKKCRQCEVKSYETCINYDYLGSRRDGGFAEFVSVPIWNLIPLNSSISYAAAALLEPLAVARHAIKMGRITKGMRIGIIGTGMIGISAAQWAYQFGADNVEIIARNENKRRFIEDLGLSYNVCQSKSDLKEYDVVLEAVGSSASIDMAINATIAGGTLILMGNPNGDVGLIQDTYWRVLRKQLTLKGTWNSSYCGSEISDWTETVDALAKQEIEAERLISHTFNQVHLTDALDLMKAHKEPYCKIMTAWNNE